MFGKSKLKRVFIKFPTNKIQENKKNDLEFGTHFLIMFANYLAFSMGEII